MNHKDENGNSVYFINASKEDWQAHRANKKQLSDKVEKKAKDDKWKTIGNTLVDDRYIDKFKMKGESHKEAKARIERELEAQLSMDLDQVQEDDRPLAEILGIYTP